MSRCCKVVRSAVGISGVPSVIARKHRVHILLVLLVYGGSRHGGSNGECSSACDMPASGERFVGVVRAAHSDPCLRGQSTAVMYKMWSKYSSYVQDVVSSITAGLHT